MILLSNNLLCRLEGGLIIILLRAKLNVVFIGSCPLARIFEERNIFTENDQRKPVFTRVVAKEYVLLNQLDQAEQYAKKSMDLHFNMFGAESVSTIRSKLYMAIVLSKNNKNKLALDMVLDIEQQISQLGIEEQSLIDSMLELKAELKIDK